MIVTNEDLPNAHQAQHQEEEVVVVVFARESRGGSAQHATVSLFVIQSQNGGGVEFASEDLRSDEISSWYC